LAFDRLTNVPTSFAANRAGRAGLRSLLPPAAAIPGELGFWHQGGVPAPSAPPLWWVQGGLPGSPPVTSWRYALLQKTFAKNIFPLIFNENLKSSLNFFAIF